MRPGLKQHGGCRAGRRCACKRGPPRLVEGRHCCCWRRAFPCGPTPHRCSGLSASRAADRAWSGIFRQPPLSRRGWRLPGSGQRCLGFQRSAHQPAGPRCGGRNSTRGGISGHVTYVTPSAATGTCSPGLEARIPPRDDGSHPRGSPLTGGHHPPGPGNGGPPGPTPALS